VSVVNVLTGGQYSQPDPLVAEFLHVTLPSQMVDITAPYPYRSVSQVGGSFAEFSLVTIVRQVPIKPTQFLPEGTAYEEGESRNPRQVDYPGQGRKSSQSFCKGA
jgi:hypothetical protein